MTLLKDDMISLRAVEPSDADQMWVMETDPRQWVHNGMAAPYSRANLLDYAVRYKADPYAEGQIRLIVESVAVSEDTGKPEIVGLLDIYALSAINHTGFIGIYIRDEFRKKDFATHALQLGEEYAGRILNLRALGAKVMDSNTASHALFRKAGYVLCGTLRSWLQTGREAHDMAIYEKVL